MEINTKYNIGDEVWMMCRNKVISAKVASISIFILEDRSTVAEGNTLTDSDIKIIKKNGVLIRYVLLQGSRRLLAVEQRLYPTKEELLNSL